MNCLVDTHTLIWYFEGNPKLSKKAKFSIMDNNNNIYISIVSFLEIAIKLSIGKLRLSESLYSIIQKAKNFDIKILQLHTDYILK